jgi:S1-C subfamily serine protease
MKVPPTPTSPKNRNKGHSKNLEELYHDQGLQHLERPVRQKRISVLMLFFILLIGFLSGILGELVFNVFLFEEGSPLAQFLQQNVAGTRTVIRTKSEQPSSDVLHTIHQSLLAVYPLRTMQGSANDAYPPEEQSGTALLLTEDGWAVTASDVLEGDGAFVAVTSDRRVLEVKHRRKDPATSLEYFRIDGGNYQAASFSDEEGVIGAPLLAMAATTRESPERFHHVSIEDLHTLTQGALESSDEWRRVILLDTTLPTVYAGGPILDARGKVVGILDAVSERGSTTALPSHAITGVLGRLLQDASVQRPLLGVRYIDIASTPGIPGSARYEKNEGALIMGSEDEPALVKGSPAAGAGVQSGDLIVSVNKKTLTDEEGLADVILNLSPEDVVTLGIIRDGEEQDLRVTLGRAG